MDLGRSGIQGKIYTHSGVEMICHYLLNRGNKCELNELNKLGKNVNSPRETLQLLCRIVLPVSLATI